MDVAAFILATLSFSVGLAVASTDEIRVDWLTPTRGSVNGETRITINGVGFAKNQFSFGSDSHVGNRVEMVSDTRVYECDVHVDGSHEKQIMCYTRAMPAGYYIIRVSVDGERVPVGKHCARNSNQCVFGTSNNHTPRLSKITPRASTPRSVLDIEGLIFTNLFEQNVEAASNGRSEEIKRVYNGAQLCEIRKPDSDEYYGLYLNNGGSSSWGHIKCLSGGTYVGNQNASFIISSFFGRSKPDASVLRVTGQHTIAMFQTYAEVFNITPSTGSVFGGTHLTISGENFDETDAPVSVEVGGQPCSIDYISSDMIVCLTPPEIPYRNYSHPGSRGWMLEIWNQTGVRNNPLEGVSSYTDPVGALHLDGAELYEYYDNGNDLYYTRMRGYFVPPEDSEYQFMIKSDDNGMLYFSLSENPDEKILIATSTYTSNYDKMESQRSERFYLEKGKKYYMEVLHDEIYGNAYMYVAALMFNTNLTNEQSAQVQNERQKIKITSTHTDEIQSLHFDDWATQSTVKEVQMVTVASPYPSAATFRIGIYGVFTEPIFVMDSASILQTALNKLPSIIPDTVSVSAGSQTLFPDSGQAFTVTFNSDRGDFPPLSLINASAISVQYDVEEVTSGVSSLAVVSLSYDGVPSSTLDMSTLDSNSIQTAIKEIFSVRCPAEVVSPAGSKYTLDYESGTNADFSRFYGDFVNDTEPFCGRYSARNPSILFQDTYSRQVVIDSYGKLCFAYKGAMENLIKINFYHNEGSERNLDNLRYLDVPFDSTPEWQYTCLDMLAMIREDFSDSTNIRVYRIAVFQIEDKNLYIDNVYIGAKEITSDLEGMMHYRRLAPPTWLLSEVTVAGNTADGYEVVMSTLACRSGLELLGVSNSYTSPGTSGNSTNATMPSSVASWENGATMLTVRHQEASPPVEGAFHLSYRNQTLTDIPVNISAMEMSALLETLHGVGLVKVEKEGDCTGFKWTVEFLTAGGDHPDFEVDQTGVTGFEVDVIVVNKQDGGVFYDPIPGDMLRSYEELPQVTVNINNIPSLCVGDCGFRWRLENTPNVTDINPINGSYSASTSLTIIGSGFSANATDNEVEIGGVACDVTFANVTQLECDVGMGPMGTYDVMVSVAGMGLADDQSGEQFTYIFGVDSFLPSSGSIAGGILVNIEGNGFGADAIVTIGNNVCEIINASYSLIVCITPPSNMTGSVDLVVNSQLYSDTAGSFTYQAPVASVTSLSSNQGSVAGFVEITLSGEGFGHEPLFDEAVTIGEVPANITAWSNDTIIVNMPPMAPGQYPLNVFVADGFADTSNISEIEYILLVHSITPSIGSLLGGMRLTVEGEGFSNTTEVRFGDVMCNVIYSDDREMLCEIESIEETHTVTNNGTNPDFGPGLAWEPKVLDVKVGDSVLWRWTTPELLSNVVGFRVEEIETASSTNYNDGFRSGEMQSKNGVYEYQFTSPGVYYYWSGGVDTAELVVSRGVVNVHSTNAIMAPLIVTDGNFEALYNVTGSVERKKRSAPCPDAADSLSCDENTNVTSSDGFAFIFSDCATPVVTLIYPNQGTVNDTITISGSGFGDQDCQNEVMVGEWECVVTSSNYSEITCQIEAGSEMEIGIPNVVTVFVNNIGIALNTQRNVMDRTFTLLPSTLNVSPKNGSLAGGTLLNITGSGFMEEAYVTIQGTECNLKSVTLTEIVCVTNTAWAGSDDVLVNIKSSTGQYIPASCIGDCVYSFSEDFTPKVFSVYPDTIDSSPVTLNISGSGFIVDSPDDVEVFVGDTPCIPSSVSPYEIICDLSNARVGLHDLLIKTPHGFPSFQDSSVITIEPIISDVSPAGGSIEGGTMVTITGLGFDDNDTMAVIGGVECDINFMNRSMIVCESPAESGTDLVVVSSGVEYAAQTFTYSANFTPVIQSVSPTRDASGNLVNISGSNFGDDVDSVMVSIGDAECNLTSVTPTNIACITSEHAGGAHDIVVHVIPLGYASGDVQFTYEMSLSSISPVEGSFGGGQHLTLTGKGFDESETNVTICGEPCEQLEVTWSEIVCLAPSNPGSGIVSCDVNVTLFTESDSLSSAFTYSDALTPTVSDVFPRRGGTGGGTRITITGSGFGNDQTVANVSIAGTPCFIETIEDTEIVCVTEPHRPSTEDYVRVEINQAGVAIFDSDNSTFEYVDVWSSTFSWGGGPLPAEGDLVVIPSDMTILLDMDTPILKMLLIQGGRLIFDEVDVQLNAENILIVDGGLLQVGTEDEPFQHEATIMMHGHPRSKELPIYGTKTLAIREGTLDLHGKHVGQTWTRLGMSASAGETSILLEQPVSWEAGDEIAIASTGDMTSMPENEQHTITSVSSNGTLLTLASPLQYDHLGETITVTGSTTIEARAEVGLLTHNIKVRGSNNDQWHDEIVACKAGFDTGEFATQTCFQGRFGEEIGYDQFGSQIMFHAPRPNEDLVTGRIENVEITYAGQAFRMGRYAIHFHLNGNMNGSYVRSCGIHQSFNRAVNIHGTHLVTVEHTVIYDIMGGAFFFEDGIETGNVWQYNLAIFVKSSSSLQNADITPAAFWVTNPNNTIRHNAAAGGSHFGFWYRLNEHPEGPSHDTSYCIQHVEMGEFYNNTVHSQGWFGLWIFKVYYPLEGGTLDGGTCSQSRNPAPAVFDTFISWNCEKGAESTGSGAIIWNNFIMVNNKKTGIDIKNLAFNPHYTEGSAQVSNSTIASQAGDLNTHPSSAGITLPLARGFRVRGTTFVNYDDTGEAALNIAHIDGKSGPDNGGFTYWLDNVAFDNSPKKAYWANKFEGVLYDLDGTLTGIVGGKAVPSMETLPTDTCTEDSAFSSNVDVPGSVCEAEVKFHRFSWNNIAPDSIQSRRVVISNEYGTDYGTYQKKRMTHTFGWMVLLLDGGITEMSFEHSEHITNLSYTGKIYDLEPEEFVVISQNLTQSPDMFSINGDFHNESSTALSYSNNYYGDWRFDDVGTIFSFIVSGRDENHLAGHSNPVDRAVNLQVFRCYYQNCILPVDPGTVPPPTGRPESAVFWSDAESWADVEEGFGGNYGNGQYGLPLEGDDVFIPEGMWMVLDVPIPKLGKLYISGVLEFEFQPNENGTYRDLSLSCTHIMITGGRLIVGWEDEPFMGQAEIILRGNHYTEDMPLNYGPNVGAKAIGVFGGLDLHGVPREVTWTSLATSARSGTETITLSEPVDWVPGDEVVIATTSYEAKETETRHITTVSADNRTLTLNSGLTYQHLSAVETINGVSYKLAAEVGLLTRNVKVIGHAHNKLMEELFGARVIVGEMMSDEGATFRGYARLSDVEFYHGGQEGYTEFYDPRYTLAFLDVGEVSHIRPSYVRKCTFNHNFSPAIGIYGTSGLVVENNVVYHTIGSGIIAWGSNNTLEKNLVTLMFSPDAWDGRIEIFKFSFDAGIHVNEATSVRLIDNVVAGSERSGFQTDGQDCSLIDSDPSALWRGNRAHSCLFGVLMMWPGDGVFPCSLFNGFTVWKNYDFGFYTQTSASLMFNDIVAIDNRVGLLPIVFGPASKSHQTADKFVEITNATFVGTSSAFDCELDKMNLTQSNIIVSKKARSWDTSASGSSGGRLGLSWPNFISKHNAAPSMSLKGSTSYQSINGIMRVSDVTFANFGPSCTSDQDFAITTNPGNDDMQHPVSFRDVTFVNVNVDNKAFIHRPNAGKVNPSDCVDMDCDAMKKALLRDEDGSFFGVSPAGALIPQSEYEWDGDPVRGLGDYRIPKTLTTDTDGNRLDVASFAPNKGIFRDSTCVWHSTYQAYECHGPDYLNAQLESLDWDTETRRLSPVALLTEGYLDLVNGPQDHGWCFGYTCQERLSTFPLLVATGKTYEIHYTGTAPQDSRIHLLNADDTQAVVFGIWYSQPWRLDVSVEDVYIKPKNGYYTANGQIAFNSPTADEFMPDVTLDRPGTNYFDRAAGVLYVLARGSRPVTIITSPLILVTFNLPAMTVDEFFGPEIVTNLALFFDIPPEKIRIADAVRESRRKKRASSDSITLEISDSPSNGTNTTSPDALSTDKFANMSASLINAYQMGMLSDILQVEIVGLEVTEPPPDTSSDTWQDVADSDSLSAPVSVQVPQEMEIEHSSSTIYEGAAFPVQPVLMMYDPSGAAVSQVGSLLVPWLVEASLVPSNDSHPDASLLGTVTVPFVLGGTANFTDLAVSHPGDYSLAFEVVSPAEAPSFSVESSVFTVETRDLDGVIINDTLDTLTVDEMFEISLQIVDAGTELPVDNIGWKGHNWTCTVSSSSVHPVSFYGHVADVDFSTGVATFYNLSIGTVGMAVLHFRFISIPYEYDFTLAKAVMVYDQGYTVPYPEVSNEVIVKFDADFSTHGDGYEEHIQSAVFNTFWTSYPNVSYANFVVYEGSIAVAFTMTGPSSDVTTTLDGIRDLLANSLVLSYTGPSSITSMDVMFVDNTQYGTTPVEEESGGLTVAVIAGIVVGSLIFLALVVLIVILLLMHTNKQKGKSNEEEKSCNKQYIENDPADSRSAAELDFGLASSRESKHPPRYSLDVVSVDAVEAPRYISPQPPMSTKMTLKGRVSPLPNYNLPQDHLIDGREVSSGELYENDQYNLPQNLEVPKELTSEDLYGKKKDKDIFNMETGTASPGARSKASRSGSPRSRNKVSPVGGSVTPVSDTRETSPKPKIAFE